MTTKEQRVQELLYIPRMFWVPANPDNISVGLLELIKNHIGPESVGAEIGSFRGVSSELFALHCQKLYCIDPFLIGDPEIDRHLQDAKTHFVQMADGYSNIIFYEETSVSAADRFSNESLDFVYIDAMHDYANVKQDILTWAPKLKKGGLLAGHGHNYSDVARAVRDTVGVCQVYSDTSWAVIL